MGAVHTQALEQGLKLDPESVRGQAIDADWKEQSDPLEQDLKKVQVYYCTSVLVY